MPPLKRSTSFFDIDNTSGGPPSKSARLESRDLRLSQAAKQLSDENTTPTAIRGENISTLAKPSDARHLTGQQDTHLTLGQIHSQSSLALVSQMLEIQRYTVSREQSEEWAANLRFLNVKNLGPRGQLRHISLTLKGEYRYRSDYVAVSYRWQIPSDPEPNPVYLIIDADGEQRGNKAPNSVLDRAINYALDHGIPFIWIDQECIPNREDCPEEHEIAIQAMDIVYRRSDYPLGLLKSSLSRKHLLLLDELLRRRMRRSKDVECWAVPPSEDEIPPIQDLLQRILIDDWWDRAWIFQEKYCGSTNMEVGLLRETVNASGNTHSFREFYFKPVQFRRVVTLFRPDLEKFSPGFGRLLDKAKHYTILNKRSASEIAPDPQFKACSTDIISDIDGGSCERPMDRLAIIANCCRYLRRLDCHRLSNLYNLSTCILTLFLLNGELLRYPDRKSELKTHSNVDHNTLTVNEFLNEYSLSFTPPVSTRQLSFIHNCRLPGVSLTPDGIATSGWIWDLTGPSLFVELPKWFIPSFRHETSLRKFHEPFLKLLCEELDEKGHKRLARQIQNFSMEEGMRSDTDELSSDHFKEQMVDALLVATSKGQDLRLANLSGEKEPSAIFISSTKTRELFPAPAKVFTSWCKRKSEYHHPNFVSLIVQPDGTSGDGHQRVRTKEWINGFWFATKEEGFEKVVFSWPF